MIKVGTESSGIDVEDLKSMTRELKIINNFGLKQVADIGTGGQSMAGK